MVAPWAPMPGARIEPLKPVGSAPRSRCVAPSTPAQQPVVGGVQRGQLVDDVLGHAAAVADRGRLDRAPVGVGGACEDVDAPTVVPRQLERRRECPDAQVRAHRDRFGGERCVVGEVGLGVAAHRGADVSTLDVEDRQGAGVSDVREHLLEHRDAAGTERLEERRLRLEHRSPLPQLLDDAAGHALEPGHVVAFAPGVEDAGHRVDADAQGAAGLADGRQSFAVGGLAHARPHSWMPRTSAGPS